MLRPFDKFKQDISQEGSLLCSYYADRLYTEAKYKGTLDPTWLMLIDQVTKPLQSDALTFCREVQVSGKHGWQYKHPGLALPLNRLIPKAGMEPTEIFMRTQSGNIYLFSLPAQDIATISAKGKPAFQLLEEFPKAHFLTIGAPFLYHDARFEIMNTSPLTEVVVRGGMVAPIIHTLVDPSKALPPYEKLSIADEYFGIPPSGTTTSTAFAM